MSNPAIQTDTPSGLAADIKRLVSVIHSGHYPTGDRAALRRWAPDLPIPLAFYRLWLQHLDCELPPEKQIHAWMALVWGLATYGEDCHNPKRPWGQALAESDFSEGRLERLLSAPEDVRIGLFMSAVRLLAAKGEHFNWGEAAEFLLTEHADKRERLNRRIATAYYRHRLKDANPKE